MKKVVEMILLVAGIFAAPVFGAARYAVFPQFASGGGWSSEFFFANQGTSTVSGVIVSFYDNDGEPLTVQSNLGSATSYTFDLDKGATKRIKVTPPTTYAEGYVVVTYPSTGSPVRATEVYRYEQNGVVSVEVGVPQQEQGFHFSFPVEISSSDGILTAVSLANPIEFNGGVPVAQTLVLNLIKQDGTIQATATVPLQSGQHIAEYVGELFPGVGDFIGTLSISSPLSAGVLAVRQDKQSFGGISTDGGPILGPFEVTTGATLSVGEYNESMPDDGAVLTPIRPLDLRVSGTIGYEGDWDSYQFQGNSGDIISVICSRASATGTNYLDPYIVIYRYAGGEYSLIAYNDQNGLAPQLYPIDNSFIQMQLPANDTYYLIVYDYDDYGDSNSAYRLDIKLP